MSDFLESQANLYPDLTLFYNEFQTLYNKKQWHQLTVSLIAFLKSGGGSQNARDGNANYVRLWSEFVKTFEAKINQLSLAKMAVMVAFSYGSEDTQSSQVLLESECNVSSPPRSYLSAG